MIAAFGRSRLCRLLRPEKPDKIRYACLLTPKGIEAKSALAAGLRFTLCG